MMRGTEINIISPILAGDQRHVYNVNTRLQWMHLKKRRGMRCQVDMLNKDYDIDIQFHIDLSFKGPRGCFARWHAFGPPSLKYTRVPGPP